MHYGSQIYCKEDDENTDENKEGGNETKKSNKNEVKLYKHRDYGCIIGVIEKKKAHSTEASQHCVFIGRFKEEIL